MKVTGAPTRLTISVEEAATVLGISRTSAYEYARTGALPVVRLGRRLLVPTAALVNLLDLSTPDRVHSADEQTPP